MAHSAPHSLAPAQGFVLPDLSQRAVLLAGIVAMHVVLIYLLASGLGATAVRVIADPMMAKLFDTPPDLVDPPPPPPTDFDRPVFDLGPTPDFRVDYPSDPPTITGPITPDPPQVVTQQQPRVEPIHLVGKHALPNTADYYPPSAIRDNAEGGTDVRVCVDARGRRDGDPTVLDSSGDARLDKAALAVARDGRYARSARGETFVPNCYAFRILFDLK